MLIQTTPPSEEPVTLAEARKQLRLTDSDTTLEDGLIAIWIAAARRYAETNTRRSFVTQGWRLVLDGFPCDGCLELEKGDVQQITSITYRDMAGATQTISWAAPSNGVQRSTDGTLVADLSGGTARIQPAFGCVWPIPMPEIACVAVNYTAGYGNATAVPEGIKSWMLLRIGSLDANREEVVDGILTALPFLDSMLDPFRVELG